MRRTLIGVVALSIGPGAPHAPPTAADVFLRVVGGDLQVAPLRSTAAEPLQVAVVDDNGHPVAGVEVIFRVIDTPDGGGFGGGASSVVVRSGRSGIASARVFAPAAEGRSQRLQPLLVEATCSKMNPRGHPGRFRIQGIRADRLNGAGAPAYLVPLGGDCTRPPGMAGECPVGWLGETLDESVGVLVVDASFRLIAGWPVTFDAELGSFRAGQSVTVRSDAFGVARSGPYTIKARHIPEPAYIALGLPFPTGADLQRVWAKTSSEVDGSQVHLETELGIYGYP